MSVDPGQAAWLSQGGLFASVTSNAASAAWGVDGIETEIMSCLALAADATVEAARQQGFLEGPLAVEVHDVPGLKEHLIGYPVTITNPRLGYAAGRTVFVIDAQEQDGVERTTLIVLRKLP